jgi:Adenylate and Guanylate cyclase catalytic domain
MVLTPKVGLVHAHFFFVDIVGLSDPRVPTRNQMLKIEVLNKLVSECPAFLSIPKEALLVLPTGDGMVIGFTQGPELPLHLAIELSKGIAKYNKGKIPSESIRIRIGIHSGPVFLVNDILNNRNIWGPGIIIARRIMDIGEDGHILMSARTAEDLRQLSYEYKKIIKPLHDYTTKHGQSLLVYSVYGTGFGNPHPPAHGAVQKSKMGREIAKLKKTTIYPDIRVDVSIIDAKKMLVHYKRRYEIENISEKPIHKVLHGIATDTDKNFDQLNIVTYDENKLPLKISSISVDKPYQKEFTTIFNKPISKGERSRYYTLEYRVEEPEKYFENTFLVGCEKFTVYFDLPLSIKGLTMYESDLESGDYKKNRSQPQLHQTSSKRNLAKWTRRNIHEGQSFRFEWN